MLEKNAPYTCEHCGMVIVRKGNLIRHMKVCKNLPGRKPPEKSDVKTIRYRDYVAQLRREREA